MLYSEILLNAVQMTGLRDDYELSLTREEKRIYSGYMRNAVARLNNDPKMSIGTEKLIISDWLFDDLGHYRRIVRDDTNNNMQVFTDNEAALNRSVSAIKWNGIDGRSMQELPQRLISATSNSWSVPLAYKIVNAKQFFELGKTDRAVFYEVSENDAVLRVTLPARLLLIFNRAILFPFETKPGERILVDSSGQPLPPGGADLQPGEIDPLETQIMLPTSHLPYFTSLAALEIALGQKMDKGVIESVKEQIASQEKALLENNVRDRVKLSYNNQDYAYQWWNRRAYR